MTLPNSRNAGPSGLHVRYEKGGLIFDQLPIPWNADAVIVEANVKLPTASPPDKQQFTLQLSTEPTPIVAELLGQESKTAPVRVFFRIPVPAQTFSANVHWREHSLGQVELPIITAAEFIQGLSLQMPTVHVGLGTATVACQSFVSTQCQTLCASAMLTSATPLAPIADLGLHVELHRANGERIADAPVHFASGQLRSRQTLLSVFLPRLRRIGDYALTWQLGSQTLHTQRLHAVSRTALQRSMRISATRFVVQKDDGAFNLLRWLPARDGQLLLDGIAQVGPCFYVCSSSVGMAGVAAFHVEAVRQESGFSPLSVEHEMVVTDGPMPLLAGMLPASDLGQVKHFKLTVGGRSLGVLPLLPAPSAQFTAEGGFAPLDEFLWSPAADELLNERLGKLLDGS